MKNNKLNYNLRSPKGKEKERYIAILDLNDGMCRGYPKTWMGLDTRADRWDPSGGQTFEEFSNEQVFLNARGFVAFQSDNLGADQVTWNCELEVFINM